MAFWIFKCNPKLYRLNERMADPNPIITDLVTRYRNEIGPGDTVFMMKTAPGRSIRGVFRVDEGPREMPELESEQTYWIERDTEIRWRVLGRITHRVNLPVGQLESVEGLENLSIFHGCHRGTNFRVTDGEGRILLSLVERAGGGTALRRSEA